MSNVTIDGFNLTAEEVLAVARNGTRVELSATSRAAMKDSRV